MKKKVDKRKLTRKMDILVSKIVRERGKCEICGRTEHLQAAHVLSRRHLQTRFDLENVLCLCVNCHFNFAHKDPIGFARWFDTVKGSKTYDRLKAKSNSLEKFDHEEMFIKLKELEGK